MGGCQSGRCEGRRRRRRRRNAAATRAAHAAAEGSSCKYTRILHRNLTPTGISERVLVLTGAAPSLPVQAVAVTAERCHPGGRE